MIPMRGEELAKRESVIEERVRLFKLLMPDDSLLFEQNGNKEYYHILEVRKDSVIGNYLDNSGNITLRQFSFQELASLNPKVAHYKCLSVQ